MTKADLKNTETFLMSEIADVKSEFNDFREDVSARFDKVDDRFGKVEKEIADVKSDLKWMKGIGAAILAAVVIPMLTETF